MKNLFNSVKLMKPKKTRFDLSHDVKLSCNMGELIPFAVLDCMPGDKFTLGCQALIRFAPLVAPVMHLFNVFMHWYFVPKRIVWNLYERWITSGNDTVNRPVMPYADITSVNHVVGDLMDYMGIPPDLNSEGGTERISVLPLAAYQMIYNEFYRDQNMVTSLYDQGDGPLDDATGDQTANTFLFQLRKSAWEHDYFTSCLPFAQKGTPVSIPIGSANTDVPVYRDRTGDGPSIIDLVSGLPDPLGIGHVSAIDPDSHITADALYAKTTQLTFGSTLINDLRRAFALQRWLERNALGGTRFIEFNKAQYGVQSSDKRLQRPEYITGTKSPIMISEVLNTTGSFDPTTPTDPTSPPQGNMAGHGVGVSQGKYGKYYCEEQGFIIGIMRILPRSAYMQGIARMWHKFDDPVQEYFDQFANIGEQEVLNKEIYAYLGPGSNPDERDGTFGYNPRYSEYKYENSRVAGEFRTTLRHWHDARHFSNQPNLNQAFIEVDETTDELARIFAVEDPDIDKLYVQVYNSVSAVRGMPKYGTPV